MANKKVVSVLSTAAIGTLIASAVGTTALAKVDGLVVKNAEGTYLNYDLTELQESAVENYLGNEKGAVLYKSFDAARATLVSYHDDKTGFIDANAIAEAAKDAILGGEEFDVNKFTEASKETALPGTVYKAVVKDGVVVKGDEVKPNGDNDEDEDLKVVSVESINAAQVKVTFNKALDGDAKDEAEDLDNYTLYNEDDDEVEDVFKSVDVEEGSNEAILTVDFSKIGDDDDEYQNQATYKLVLDENITGTEISKEFKVSDFEIPEVTSAEVVGIRTIKVHLSEPIVSKNRTPQNIYEDLEDAFEVNEGGYSIEKVEPINNGKELNIVLYSKLKDGEKLTLNVKSEAEDYAGYSLKKAKLDLKADFNTEDLAIVGYKKAKDQEITLVFNKDIKFADHKDDTMIANAKVDKISEKYPESKGYTYVSDDDFFESFYHTTSKNAAEAVVIDGNELTLYFDSDHSLPETAYVFVDADVLEDLWEKENDGLNIKANVSKDKDRPEIKKVEQDDDSNKKIILTFSEDLDLDSATDEDNYTVKDKDGKAVRVSKAKLTDSDEVTLELSKDLEDGEEYEVTIEDVEDKAGNKIEKVTKKFTAKDTQAVTKDDISAKFYDASKSSQKIVVDFGTKMLADGSRYAINNLDNYDLTIVKGGKTYEINLSDYDGASVKAVDNATKAELRLPGNKEDLDDQFNFTGATLTLDINKVEDANGNRTGLLRDITVNGSAASIGLDEDNDEPVAVDRETIKIVFDDEVKFDGDDVKLKEQGTGNEIIPASTKVEKANGKTTVTYTLKEADQLSYDGKHNGHKVVVVVDGNKSENKYGDTLLKATYTVKDEIAPELAKIDDNNVVVKNTKIDDRDDYDDAVVLTSFSVTNPDGDPVTKDGIVTATVELTFEEALDTTNIEKNINLFKVDDKDVRITNVTTNGSDKVVLTLSAKESDYDEALDFLGLGITTETNKVYDLAVDKDGNSDANGAVVDTDVEYVPLAIRGIKAIEDQIEELASEYVTVNTNTNIITATVKDGKTGAYLKDVLPIDKFIKLNGALVTDVNGQTTVEGIKNEISRLAGKESFNEITLEDLDGEKLKVTVQNGKETVTYVLNLVLPAQQ
ncbi:Ig-like domain-containing protein [Clostridium thermopalmarium]|uniref:Outer cell wall protein n=1 Tax=Clostridium thermopalmarium DSM 5974 TaxID=1121340 RepID=A0A2T0AZA5_9CLOT|nr:Ig-like domain-containing protein [Clostridium thermopalmarium]PRR76531.1 Outer cell wall protein precursor [Clostridium thermopalmarium DSM 5974]PVZ28356.1 intein [Clostridium thermopalmarium DSM 5974]